MRGVVVVADEEQDFAELLSGSRTMGALGRNAFGV